MEPIQSNKIYPIGIQNFEKMRKGGYFYVDKTALVYRLVKTGSYYFLSRPRRFGKSLLISTLEAYFQGKKELFEGLAMEKLEKDWIKRPVLHIDLNIGKYDTPDSLDKQLEKAVTEWEQLYGTGMAESTLALRFAGVVRRACEQTGQRVAILIDEYDKPMLQAIGNKALQNEFRNTLKPFYGVLKTMDGCIQFALLTGVTKFGKVSVFSDLNNLNDISMDRRYLALCGVTDEELRQEFAPSIRLLAQAQNMTYEETCQRLQKDYDGYHFTHNSIGIYNPFSLLNTFKNKEFLEYWFETGTPSFLVKVMRKTSYDVTRLSSDLVGSSLLSDVNTAFLNPVPLLYQSGYLTIKGFDPRFNLYTLGFPNMEVKDGFLNFLLGYYAPIQSDSTNTLISLMSMDVESGNPEGFMTRLDALFARTNYQIQGDCEKDFQYAMYIIIELMGEYVETERTTSNGRIDILIKTKDYVYIIEIKTDSTPDEALAQIEEKGYARPFADDRRRIFRIGVNFSTANRRIDGWKVV